MIARVTKRGVVVPKSLLDGAKAVEILKENKRIVIVPCEPDDDSIWGLGTDPIKDDIADASVNHDQHLGKL
jgi:hypothetical protein